jgi:hypothetical protein
VFCRSSFDALEVATYEPYEFIPVTVIPTKVGIQRLADWIPTFVARSMTAIAGLMS